MSGSGTRAGYNLPDRVLAHHAHGLDSQVIPLALSHAVCVIGASASQDETSVLIQMKSIYVGNLPFTATEDEIRTLFSQFGTVETVNLISDRDTGRPRGFGFVGMNNAEADAAIKGLNGRDMGGRALRINEAEERKPQRQSRW